MGKLCLKFGGAALTLLGLYFVALAIPKLPLWTPDVLFIGFVVVGILFLLTGLVYLFLLGKKHLNPLDILDDLQCTYWTLERQLKVTSWFRDYSNSPISQFSCVAQFEKQTLDVNDRKDVNGTYFVSGKASYGKSRPIMVEFFKNDIKISNPNKAIITVSIKPQGIWATKKRKKKVAIQLVRHE